MAAPDQTDQRVGFGKAALLIVVVTAAGAGGSAVLMDQASQPRERSLIVIARQYAYEPPRIRVNQGDTIHLKLASRDVIHGFYLEGYDLDAEIRPQQKTFYVRHPKSGRPEEEVEEVTFVARRRGKFRYRCSHTCGTLHPFMNGELIVGPNTPLHAGVGGVVGLFLGMLGALRLRSEAQVEAESAAAAEEEVAS